MHASTFGFRVAVVTGGNKGIGYEICRQLASNGVRVILTARDEKRGMEAVEKLKQCGHKDVIFHQLDVTNPSTFASLVDFINTHFGRLDILVNNAGIIAYALDMEILNALRPKDYENTDPSSGTPEWYRRGVKETYEMAEEGFQVNFYGTKTAVEALLPLLHLSKSARIVNVSSGLGQIKFIPSDEIKKVLSDDGLTEERLFELSNCFLKDFKEGRLEAVGWPTFTAAYKVSKALVNAYTRILAKKNPSLCINCVGPGFTKTDLNLHTGFLTTEEAAKGPVMLALLPDGSPSGYFFRRTELSTF